MAYILQTTFNINEKSFFTAHNQKTVQKYPLQSALHKTKMVDSSKQQKFSDKSDIIIGSLSSLALLGTAGYLIKRGIIVNNYRKQEQIVHEKLAQTSHLKALEIDSAHLKKLLKQDYLYKKQHVLKRMNEFDEFAFEIPFNSIQDLRTKIKTIESENDYLIPRISETVRDNRKIIRNKLEALSLDPEWNEIKELRKNLIKRKSKASGDQLKIIMEKIPMVNDLLINKIYPEDKAAYKHIYGLDNDTVFKLVKEDFKTHKDFIERYNSLKDKTLSIFAFQAIDKRFSHDCPLTLKILFPKEFENVYEGERDIIRLNQKLEAAKQLLADYYSQLKELAMKYRNTEGIRTLKENTLQINTLQNK